MKEIKEKSWKSIEIPERISENCKIDPKRGFPVPYVVFVSQEGEVFFKINDSGKTFNCMLKGLCTICGQVMDKEDRWLVGGVASSFDERGAFIDLPIHKECAEYALKVCPYLASRNYNWKELDLTKLSEKTGAKLENPTVDPDRLPFFVLSRPTGIIYRVGEYSLSLVPKKPYLEVEFWDQGKRIKLEEAKSKLIGTKWEKYINSLDHETKV